MQICQLKVYEKINFEVGAFSHAYLNENKYFMSWWYVYQTEGQILTSKDREIDRKIVFRLLSL